MKKMLGLKSVIFVMSFGVAFAGCGDQFANNVSDDESAKIKAQVEDVGLDKIILQSVPPKEASNGKEAKTFGLTRKELRSLMETIPTLAKSSVCRVVEKRVVNMGRPDDQEKHHYKIVGCTTDYFADSKIEVAYGHVITQREIDSKSNVCVLPKKVATELFLEEDPIGKMIYLPTNRMFLKVVGVMKSRKPRGSLGALPSRDFSTEIYIPITTMRTRLGDLNLVRTENSFSASSFEISQAILTVKDIKDVEQTAKAIETTLKKGRENRSDIKVVVPARILKKASNERN